MLRYGVDSERRRFVRYTVAPGKRLSRVQGSEAVLVGRTIDISDGGVRIALDGQVPLGEVVKCELGLADLPVLIPTLTQVQWCLELSSEHLCGLKFLI